MNDRPDFLPETPPADPATLIGEYVSLRDQKKNAEETFKAFLKANYTRRMDEIETILLATLNEHNLDSVKAATGTAYKSQEVSVTVADPREFQRHVIGQELWHLIDWRANKTAVKAYLEEEQTLPPGVNYSATYVVNVRRPS